MDSALHLKRNTNSWNNEIKRNLKKNQILLFINQVLLSPLNRSLLWCMGGLKQASECIQWLQYVLHYLYSDYYLQICYHLKILAIVPSSLLQESVNSGNPKREFQTTLYYLIVGRLFYRIKSYILQPIGETEAQIRNPHA